MNNKIKKIIIITFTFLLIIFVSNIIIKESKINKSDITNMNIIKYIPSNYELIILSNSTNHDIKEFVNKNISEQKKEELNIIKDSIISYLGFDLKGKIENIYDNEFAITFVENKLSKNDILFIFKIKNNKDINDIINIGNDLPQSNQIIEIKRLGKLNYISHIYQTKDNYILASTNRNLINNSLELNNNINIKLSRDLIPNDINLKEIKLLSILKNDLIKNSNSQLQRNNELITIVDSENDKIKIKSFSPNLNKINSQNLNKKNTFKNIIFTNKYSPYKENLNFLYSDINQKEFINQISKKVNNEILFITKDNNWVLCFKSKFSNKILDDQLNFFKKYKKEDLYINNINYSIFSNNRLRIEDNNITYDKEDPIFTRKDMDNIYISNNFNTLLNITEETSLFDQYLNNNSEIKPYKYILNDFFFIKNINNKQLIKYFKSLKNLQYFLNTELFSLQDININIRQVIPERDKTISLELDLNIL
tara:strand:+ start:786 stop:2225 length:1440 start_codon:yes stop_codon:yes gene_type:complete